MSNSPFLYNIKTKYPKSKHVGEFGVNRCIEFFRRLGWIPRSLNQQEDVGLDVIVETTIEKKNNCIPTGYQIGIQVKSGKSYFYESKNEGKYFILSSSNEHKRNWDYWVQNPLPVFLFFYYDDMNIYSFFNINKWERSIDEWQNIEPLPIKSYNIFNYETMKSDKAIQNELENEFLSEIESKQYQIGIFSLFESIFYDDNKAFESITILLRNYKTRYSPALSFLYPHILHSNNDEIVKLGFFCLINWIDYNLWAPKERDKVVNLGNEILNGLTLNEWERIISVVDILDYYTDYGNYDNISSGFDILRCLALLRNYKSKFLEIAKRETFSTFVRINALAISLLGISIRSYYMGFNPDYLTWNVPHIIEFFSEKKIRASLEETGLLKMVADYYRIDFIELANKKITEYLNSD